jgi:predicted nuclease of predicted toxin-antitoxin system
LAKIRLYLDEDLRPLLAQVLRQRGFEADSAVDLGRLAIPDADHFAYATREQRAILTFNIRDFVPLATQAMARGDAFAGLVVSEQLEFRDLLAQLEHFAGRK